LIQRCLHNSCSEAPLQYRNWQRIGKGLTFGDELLVSISWGRW